ncbi:MAG: amidase [Sphingomonadales bacterium]|jgi:Asp-tRNA(Asn)/Glu-tRNA(Gln) amidotransferase A subunit family amidase
MTGFNRRAMMKAMGLGAVGFAGLSSSKASELIDKSALESCSSVLGLNFSEAEQAQALNIIDDQIESIRRLRAYAPENALAPAEIFDPRLKSQKLRQQVQGTTLSRNVPKMPNNAEDIAFAPVTWQARWLREGDITSRELTEIYLDRIERFGDDLQCFVTVTAELARKQADAADKELRFGRTRSPLHGIPYGLKDLVDTKDIKTTWGAEPYKNRVAKDDAFIVKRLEEAGAVLLGKTTCGALAYGDIWFGGKTRNPWNLEEGSSGSSAGSASAVGAGLASFAIGTETLGSIVSPCNRNGVTGLRPTFGRVSRTGAMALCWSLDKIGPICRTVWDNALVLAAINGADVEDEGSIDIPFTYDIQLKAAGMKLGYDPKWFEGDQAADTDRDMLEAAKRAGLELVEVELPDLPYGELGNIVTIESAAAFEQLTLSNKDDDLKWQDDFAWPNTFRTTHYFPAVSYVQAQRLRREVMKAFADVMKDVDALIHPNYASNLLLIGNMTGYPTLAMRAGFIEQPTRTLFGSYVPKSEIKAGTETHLVPRSGSLTGHLFDEGRLLAIGAAIEKELDIWKKRPKIS